MKKMVLFLVVAVAMFSFTGCYYRYGHEAYVKLGQQDGEIIIKEVGGNTTPERGLKITEKQAETNIKVLIQKKVADAIKKGNMEEAKKWQNFFDEEKAKYVHIGFWNNTKCTLTVQTEPFKGQTVLPGKILPPQDVPVGQYTYSVAWPPGSCVGEGMYSLEIKKGRKNPIEIY